MSIATYIKQDVASRIASGEFTEGSVTLESLSKQYQVSATPVRAAVRELVSEGYLKKGPNRRLVVSQDVAGKAAPPPEPEQPKDYYKTIFEDLVRLSLRGESVLLREEVTAEQYGISRSSIRQIFHRLVGDRVLWHLPRRGWELRPFRPAHFDAYMEVRVVLELKALELAWPHLVDAELQAMLDRQCLPESRDAELPPDDDSLHRYLLEKANNPYLTDFFERHYRYYKVLTLWETTDRETRIATIGHRREILEAMLARDRRAAKRALQDHIRHSQQALGDAVRAAAAQRTGEVQSSP